MKVNTTGARGQSRRKSRNQVSLKSSRASVNLTDCPIREPEDTAEKERMS